MEKTVMKKYRAIIFIVLLMLITGVMAALHLKSREEVPEGAIEVSYGEEKYIVDIHELAYENVSGIRVNGKGEEIPVEGAGILLKDLLAKLEITEFVTVSVVADDAYSADVTAEEIKNNIEAYLIQEEGEERLRLVVFGDKDSKRSVSNVAQIIVKDLENVEDTAVTFTDDLGREVTVNNPQRVAVLLGSFADMWVLAGGEVIASPDDAWEDFHLDMPETAVNLGHTKELNMEKNPTEKDKTSYIRNHPDYKKAKDDEAKYKAKKNYEERMFDICFAMKYSNNNNK